MKRKEEKFKLVTPTIAYKRKAIKYIKEHNKYKSPINGSGLLYNYLDDYEEWLKLLECERNIVADGIQVPTETFFLVRSNDNEIVGMINIRLELNDRIRNSYGSIGYGIRPKERRKGYNKINLYLGLKECQKRGIKGVILSCEKGNMGSSKTMLALGGKFVKEKYSEDQEKLIQFYAIDVDSSLDRYKDVYEKYTEKCEKEELELE